MALEPFKSFTIEPPKPTESLLGGSRYGAYDNVSDFSSMFGDTKSANDGDAWVLPYEPRSLMIPFHQRKERFAFLICHRRFGKTVACIAELVVRALYTKKKTAQYAYICPFRSQAKAVAWNYLVEMTNGIAVDIKVSELSITLPNGAKIWLSGSDNINALRGIYLDGAVLDEFAQCRPDLLDAVIMPCLLDRKGWLVIIGTAYGRLNQFYSYYEKSKEEEEWFHADIKVTDSNIIPIEEQERIRGAISDAKWKQEFCNDFSAELVGTYYAEQINGLEEQGRINNKVLWRKELPVKVAFDIGRKDNTVCWFWQEDQFGVHWIDYYTNNGEQAQHYIDMIKGKPYDISEVYLPHDAKAMTFATNKSALEQFVYGFEDSTTFVSIVPKLSVSDGIEATRQLLKHSHFNYDACYYGVECLRVYRKKWNETTQVFSDTPLHDYASDSADSFRYACIMANKTFLPAPAPHESIKNSIIKSNEVSLEEMFLANERSKNKRSFVKSRV
tara:strand:- start:1852 stop:3351 length:1500 start_codon:yes stop_codon:yes gene_type:complete